MNSFTKTITLVSLFIGICASACFKNLPQKNVVYNNDFEAGNLSDIQIYNIYGRVDSIKTVAFNGSRVLGRFNNNLVMLRLNSLPTHNALKFEFDLLVHGSWDGNHLQPGNTVPDVWVMRVNNFPVYQTTFSNGQYTQSFPDNYQSNVFKNPARANAWDVLPGVCATASEKDGTTRYKIEYTTAHTGNLELALNDALQPFNSTCLKSWSIDNLVVTAIQYQ